MIWSILTNFCNIVVDHGLNYNTLIGARLLRGSNGLKVMLQGSSLEIGEIKRPQKEKLRFEDLRNNTILLGQGYTYDPL